MTAKGLNATVLAGKKWFICCLFTSILLIQKNFYVVFPNAGVHISFQSVSFKWGNSIYINYQVSIYLTVVQLNPNEGALVNDNINDYGSVVFFFIFF